MKHRQRQLSKFTWEIVLLKIEYHAVGDNWWQPLLSYGK